MLGSLLFAFLTFLTNLYFKQREFKRRSNEGNQHE
ncbi:phage holin [Acinetobacter indicus]